MRYLGNNQYWFESEQTFKDYIFTGGYQKSILVGEVIHRYKRGAVLAIILA